MANRNAKRATPAPAAPVSIDTPAAPVSIDTPAAPVSIDTPAATLAGLQGVASIAPALLQAAMAAQGATPAAPPVEMASATPAAPKTRIAGAMLAQAVALAESGKAPAAVLAVADTAGLTPATGGAWPGKPRNVAQLPAAGALLVGNGNTPAPSGETGQGGVMRQLDRLRTAAGVGVRGAVCYRALVEACYAAGLDATLLGGETRACTNSAKGNRAPDGGNTGPFTVYVAPAPQT